MGILLANIAAAVIWILCLVRLDRYRDDKRGTAMFLRFYFVGFLSVIPTFFLEWIHPLSRFSVDSPVLGSALEEFLVTGPVEEFSKFIVFFLFARLWKSIKEPLDGAIQAGAVALAFASLENVAYGLWVPGHILLLRLLLSSAGHVTYAVIWGFYSALGLYGVRSIREIGPSDLRYLLVCFLPSALLHGLYNFLVVSGLLLAGILLDLLSVLLARAIYRYLRSVSPFEVRCLRDHRRAIPQLCTALRNHPDSLLLNTRLVQFFLHIGNYAEALARLEHCLRAHPRSVLVRCLKGAALILGGRVEEGRRLFQESYRRLRPSGRAALRRNLLKVLEPTGPGTSRGEAVGSRGDAPGGAAGAAAPGDPRGCLRCLLRHPAELLLAPRPLPRRAEVRPLKARNWYLAVESRPTGKSAAAK